MERHQIVASVLVLPREGRVGPLNILLPEHDKLHLNFVQGMATADT
jgi:hypothetical protein